MYYLREEKILLTKVITLSIKLILNTIGILTII